MTKSYDKILKILQDKGENLSKDDIKLIRNEYPFLSFKEFEEILKNKTQEFTLGKYTNI